MPLPMEFLKNKIKILTQDKILKKHISISKNKEKESYSEIPSLKVFAMLILLMKIKIITKIKIT
jgi:hypothetical protein